MYNENTKKNTIKYIKEKQKRVEITFLLQDYEALKASAAAADLPVNTYIKEAIKEKQERQQDPNK